MDRSAILGEKKIADLLWEFSVPAITGMVVTALYNVVDSIFVGQGVGEIGLTAVTIAFPLMLILMGIGMLVGLGAAALVSIRLGEGKREAAEKILANALIMMVLFVVVSSAAMLLYLDPLLVLLGATPDVLPYAHDFTSIIIWGSVFLHVSFGLNGVIRAQGDPKTALATMLIAALLNTVLNPLFIFVFHMGIRGSAWATVVSQAVATVWVLLYFYRGSGTLRLTAKALVIDPGIMRNIVRIGMPPFLLQIGNSLVMLIFNYSLLEFGGSVAVAAFGIVNRVLMLLLMPVMGISQGAQPIIGYNFGSGRPERVKRTLLLAIWAATGICAAGFGGVQLFHEQIIRLFNAEPELITLGSAGLRTFLIMLPVIGFQIIGANYFQAVGKAGYAVALNLLRQFVVLIPMLYLLPHYWGLQGIWAAGPVADFVSAVVTGIVLSKEMRALKKKVPREPLL